MVADAAGKPTSGGTAENSSKYNFVVIRGWHGVFKEDGLPEHFKNEGINYYQLDYSDISFPSKKDYLSRLEKDLSKFGINPTDNTLLFCAMHGFNATYNRHQSSVARNIDVNSLELINAVKKFISPDQIHFKQCLSSNAIAGFSSEREVYFYSDIDEFNFTNASLENKNLKNITRDNFYSSDLYFKNIANQIAFRENGFIYYPANGDEAQKTVFSTKIALGDLLKKTVSEKTAYLDRIRENCVNNGYLNPEEFERVKKHIVTSKYPKQIPENLYQSALLVASFEDKTPQLSVQEIKCASEILYLLKNRDFKNNEAKTPTLDYEKIYKFYDEKKHLLSENFYNLYGDKLLQLAVKEDLVSLAQELIDNGARFESMECFQYRLPIVNSYQENILNYYVKKHPDIETIPNSYCLIGCSFDKSAAPELKQAYDRIKTFYHCDKNIELSQEVYWGFPMRFLSEKISTKNFEEFFPVMKQCIKNGAEFPQDFQEIISAKLYSGELGFDKVSELSNLFKEHISRISIPVSENYIDFSDIPFSVKHIEDVSYSANSFFDLYSYCGFDGFADVELNFSDEFIDRLEKSDVISTEEKQAVELAILAAHARNLGKDCDGLTGDDVIKLTEIADKMNYAGIIAKTNELDLMPEEANTIQYFASHPIYTIDRRSGDVRKNIFPKK